MDQTLARLSEGLKQQRAQLDLRIAEIEAMAYKPSAPIAALIEWRDSLAGDWDGEDLVFTLFHSLRDLKPEGTPVVPGKHLKALRDFQAMTPMQMEMAIRAVFGIFPHYPGEEDR